MMDSRPRRGGSTVLADHTRFRSTTLGSKGPDPLDGLRRIMESHGTAGIELVLGDVSDRQSGAEGMVAHHDGGGHLLVVGL